MGELMPTKTFAFENWRNSERMLYSRLRSMFDGLCAEALSGEPGGTNSFKSAGHRSQR